ncbi:MAG: metal-dependent transcriptional regulator [Anaerolineae bacterium]|nr:MAG: metal-dependent transcriptional regulator [Anaerolineae bacterium]
MPNSPDSPTTIMQDYLAEIYRIASYQQEPYVSTSELADRMEKTAPAVVRMASRLDEAGLIEHERYQGIRLTQRGEREALASIRRHRIVESFLVKVMGLGWHEVHKESDKLAGAVSEKLLELMEKMAGHPTRCPHGEPIPTREGTMPKLDDIPLADLEPEQKLVISRVNTHDPEKLIYLQDIRLIPGQAIDLVARAPFNGPLRLRIDRDEQVIGVELARALRVCQRP